MLCGVLCFKLTKLFSICDFSEAKDSGKVLIIIVYYYYKFYYAFNAFNKLKLTRENFIKIINKPLSGWLVYQTIVPKDKRLS